MEKFTVIVLKNIEKMLISEKAPENIVNTLAKQVEKYYNYKDFIMVSLLCKYSAVFVTKPMQIKNESYVRGYF